MNRAVLGWLAVLLVVTGASGIWLGLKYAGAIGDVGSEAVVDLSYLKPPADASQPWLKEFTLTSQAGKPVASKELAGRVYITNFFFSNCPGTCLQQNQKIAEIAREYGPKGVRFLGITCDPDNDDPRRLREYGAKLNADPAYWSMLTGDLTYIRRIAGEIYQIPLDKQTHSERFFVTDKWGKLRGNFEWNKLDEITQMKLLLDELLAEAAAPPTATGDREQETGNGDEAAEAAEEN
jgi:protein SCO1/2